MRPELAQIARLFRNSSPYEAHEQSRPLLMELARDTTFFHAIVQREILSGNYFSNKKSTVIDFPVYEDERITLMLHCFMPLPDRSTDWSHQSIHHHGNLLLTTAAVWGKGYSSAIFQSGFTVNEHGEATMELAKFYQNQLHTVEFVDAGQPHIVFYPEELSITLVVWSKNRFSWTDKLRKIRMSEATKDSVKRLIRRLGLKKMSNLNYVEGFDFTLENGRIVQLTERITVPTPRSKENYVQNVLYILQQTGFTDLAFFGQLKQELPASEYVLFAPWIAAFTNGASIPDQFVPEHRFVPRMTISKKELLGAVGAEDK